MGDYLNFDLSLPDYSLAPADQRLLREGQSVSDIANGLSYTEYDGSFGKLDLADPFRLGYNMSASYWSGGDANQIAPGIVPKKEPTEHNTTTTNTKIVWIVLGLGVGALLLVRML